MSGRLGLTQPLDADPWDLGDEEPEEADPKETGTGSATAVEEDLSDNDDGYLFEEFDELDSDLDDEQDVDDEQDGILDAGNTFDPQQPQQPATVRQSNISDEDIYEISDEEKERTAKRKRKSSTPSDHDLDSPAAPAPIVVPVPTTAAPAHTAYTTAAPALSVLEHCKGAILALVADACDPTTIRYGGYVAGVLIAEIEVHRQYKDTWMQIITQSRSVPEADTRWVKGKRVFFDVLTRSTASDLHWLQQRWTEPPQVRVCIRQSSEDKLNDPWGNEDKIWQYIACLLRHLLRLRPADVMRAMFWLRTLPRGPGQTHDRWLNVLPLPDAVPDPLITTVHRLLSKLAAISGFDPFVADSWQYAGWEQYLTDIRIDEAGEKGWLVVASAPLGKARAKKRLRAVVEHDLRDSIFLHFRSAGLQNQVHVIPRYNNSYASPTRSKVLFIGTYKSEEKPDSGISSEFEAAVSGFIRRRLVVQEQCNLDVKIVNNLSSPVVTSRGRLDIPTVRSIDTQVQPSSGKRVPSISLGQLWNTPKTGEQPAQLIVFARQSGHFQSDLYSINRQVVSIVSALGELQQQLGSRPVQRRIKVVVEQASSAKLSIDERAATSYLRELQEPVIICTINPTRLTRRRDEIDYICDRYTWFTLGFGTEPCQWTDVDECRDNVGDFLDLELPQIAQASFISFRATFYERVLSLSSNDEMLYALRRLAIADIKSYGCQFGFILIVVRVSPDDAEEVDTQRASRACLTQAKFLCHILAPLGLPYHILTLPRVSARCVGEVVPLIRDEIQKLGGGSCLIACTSPDRLVRSREVYDELVELTKEGKHGVISTIWPSSPLPTRRPESESAAVDWAVGVEAQQREPGSTRPRVQFLLWLYDGKILEQDLVMYSLQMSDSLRQVFLTNRGRPRLPQTPGRDPASLQDFLATMTGLQQDYFEVLLFDTRIGAGGGPVQDDGCPCRGQESCTCPVLCNCNCSECHPKVCAWEGCTRLVTKRRYCGTCRGAKNAGTPCKNFDVCGNLLPSGNHLYCLTCQGAKNIGAPCKNFDVCGNLLPSGNHLYCSTCQGAQNKMLLCAAKDCSHHRPYRGRLCKNHKKQKGAAKALTLRNASTRFTDTPWGDIFAAARFTKSFPAGIDIVEASGRGLLRSIRALRDSIGLQLQRPPPSIAELQGHLSQGARDIDRLGTILHSWGLTQGLDLRLGFRLMDGRPFLIGTREDYLPTTSIVWIAERIDPIAPETPEIDCFNGVCRRLGQEEAAQLDRLLELGTTAIRPPTEDDVTKLILLCQRLLVYPDPIAEDDEMEWEPRTLARPRAALHQQQNVHQQQNEYLSPEPTAQDRQDEMEWEPYATAREHSSRGHTADPGRVIPDSEEEPLSDDSDQAPALTTDRVLRPRRAVLTTRPAQLDDEDGEDEEDREDGEDGKDGKDEEDGEYEYTEDDEDEE